MMSNNNSEVNLVMDLTTMITFLSDFGFPVFAFLVAVYALKYSFDKSTEQNEKQLNKYDKVLEQVSELATAVNNNTMVLTNLVQEIQNKSID